MTAARNILLVDDEAQWLRTLSVTLRRLVKEAEVETCIDSRQVLSRLAAKEYALVLLDLTMPFHSGEELLQQIRQHSPNTRVIIVTGVNQVDTGVRCIKLGAYDYFIKSGEVDDLVASVRKALEVVGLEQSLAQLKSGLLERRLRSPDAFAEILTCEPSMLDRLHYLEAIATSPAPVLLQGETGVGKQQLARALHLVMGEKGTMHSIKCGTLDEQQLELVLFGRGVSEQQPAQTGLVHQSGTGVLYLADVDRLTHTLQSKLVELIQHKQYYPVGSSSPYPCRCRVVVSSCQSLEPLLAKQSFNLDLFYLLKAHQISVPSLRQRPRDLPMILTHLVEQAANQMGRASPQIPATLAPRLAKCELQGNLPQLSSLVYDAVSRSDENELNLAPFLQVMGEETDLQQEALMFPDQLPTLAQMSKALIDEAMSRSANNQSVAAKMLGISQSALSRRLAKQEQD